jgi:hypothetical protein
LSKSQDISPEFSQFLPDAHDGPAVGTTLGTYTDFVDNHEIVQHHGPMARPSRIVVPGYPHHVTQRGVRSMNVFHEESDRREHLEMLGEEIVRREMRRLRLGLRRSPVGT